MSQSVSKLLATSERMLKKQRSGGGGKKKKTKSAGVKTRTRTIVKTVRVYVNRPAIAPKAHKPKARKPKAHKPKARKPKAHKLSKAQKKVEFLRRMALGRARAKRAKGKR